MILNFLLQVADGEYFQLYADFAEWISPTLDFGGVQADKSRHSGTGFLFQNQLAVYAPHSVYMSRLLCINKSIHLIFSSYLIAMDRFIYTDLIEDNLTGNSWRLEKAVSACVSMILSDAAPLNRRH